MGRQRSDDLPLLYISLGTVINNQPDFYQHCFEAFGNQPWQVVLSIGKTIDVTQLGSVPDNFLLSPYVPQLEILLSLVFRMWKSRYPIPHSRVYTDVTHYSEKHRAAWQEARNQAASSINWRFTTPDARIKLKRLYPTVK